MRKKSTVSPSRIWSSSDLKRVYNLVDQPHFRVRASLLQDLLRNFPNHSPSDVRDLLETFQTYYRSEGVSQPLSGIDEWLRAFHSLSTISEGHLPLFSYAMRCAGAKTSTSSVKENGPDYGVVYNYLADCLDDQLPDQLGPSEAAVVLYLLRGLKAKLDALKQLPEIKEHVQSTEEYLRQKLTQLLIVQEEFVSQPTKHVMMEKLLACVQAPDGGAKINLPAQNDPHQPPSRRRKRPAVNEPSLFYLNPLAVSSAPLARAANEKLPRLDPV